MAKKKKYKKQTIKENAKKITNICIDYIFISIVVVCSRSRFEISGRCSVAYA